ncbi:MAG: hypothetical protein AB7W16_08925 [Candidatus Obscuribacterales bacterium]
MKNAAIFTLKFALNLYVFFVFAISFSLTLYTVIDLITGESTVHVSFLCGMAALLGLVSACSFGILLFQVMYTRVKTRLREEGLILALAKEKGGLLPLSETALAGKMSIASAKHALARLSATGICHMAYHESCIFYRFPSFEPAGGADLPSLERSH